MSDDLLQIILDEVSEKMNEAVSHSRREFATVRTGRASPSLLERISVEAYGVEMQMQELATFSVPEARQLLITLHDPTNIPAVEKAINQADIGLTPSTDGRTVRLIFPELTEERRRDLVRLVNGMAEESKNRLRGLRRNARKDLDDLSGSSGVSEDDIKWVADQLDDLIHKHEAEIEVARLAKEEELLEV
tara:strand:+ start:34 stop:603 length:570 start_codon:yes stop_codon:yes gene_type:complete